MGFWTVTAQPQTLSAVQLRQPAAAALPGVLDAVRRATLPGVQDSASAGADWSAADCRAGQRLCAGRVRARHGANVPTFCRSKCTGRLTNDHARAHPFGQREQCVQVGASGESLVFRSHRELERTQPRLEQHDCAARVVLPGDPADALGFGQRDIECAAGVEGRHDRARGFEGSEACVAEAASVEAGPPSEVAPIPASC